jgi:electron transfer flavoprotein alpha/beta subunit
MSDPVEVLLNSPRSVKAMENLGFRKEDLNSLSKEELKAKLGNMKMSKADLEGRWTEHEQERKDKIQRVLEVSNSLYAED